MKKQAVMAFALTIVASYYISEILYQDAKADFEEARAVDVVVAGQTD
jgi:hypothetical protein